MQPPKHNKMQLATTKPPTATIGTPAIAEPQIHHWTNTHNSTQVPNTHHRRNKPTTTTKAKPTSIHRHWNNPTTTHNLGIETHDPLKQPTTQELKPTIH